MNENIFYSTKTGDIENELRNHPDAAVAFYAFNDLAGVIQSQIVQYYITYATASAKDYFRKVSFPMPKEWKEMVILQLWKTEGEPRIFLDDLNAMFPLILEGLFPNPDTAGNRS